MNVTGTGSSPWRGEYLHFYSENQDVYQWSTLTHGDDPPVFGRYESTDPWKQEDVTLSEHLVLTCLFEAVCCHAKYGASISWLEEEKLSEITRTIPLVAIAPWLWMDGTRFFCGAGCLHVCGWRFRVDRLQDGAPAPISQALC
jgi:hypothetical protein